MELIGATVRAFGNSWQFSRDVLKALKPLGVGAQATLVTLVINVTPLEGWQDGRYVSNYFGIELAIEVQGSRIQVDLVTSTAAEAG